MVVFEFNFIIAILFLSIAAFFDIFNKRNIPEYLLYIFLFVSFIYSIIYNYNEIFYALAQSFGVIGIGYIMYKRGHIGLADPLIIASIILLFPSLNLGYVKMPFLIPLFIYSGLSFGIVSIIYYFYVSFKKGFEKINVLGLIPVILLLLILYLQNGLLINFNMTAMLILITIISSIVITFEYSFKKAAVSYKDLSYDLIEEVIAYDFLDKDIKDIVKDNRVIDAKMLESLKKAKVKQVPIYDNLLPFVPFLLIGFLLSFFMGGSILF